MDSLQTTRRGFLKSGTGAALSIGFALPLAAGRLEAATPAVFAPNAWLRITGDGTVTVINTLDRTVVATIAVGSLPMNVAVTPDGSKVYVSNSGSDTVSVMHKGRQVDGGPIETVFGRPDSAYTRELIDAIPGRSLPVLGGSALAGPPELPPRLSP